MSQLFSRWSCLTLGVLLAFALNGCKQDNNNAKSGDNSKQNSKSTDDKGKVEKKSPTKDTDKGKGKKKFELPKIAEVMGNVPEFKLTDQDGNSYGTDQLKGQVWVANFIFTTCKSTCPEQTQKMQEIQQILKLQEANNPALDGIKLISFTVDPNTDTPETLKKYADSNDADQATWKFLTGSREAIWELCEKGFKLPVAEDKDNTDSPIAHDPRFVLVDRQMRIRGYFNVTDKLGMDKFTKAFALVLPEITPPSYFADRFEGDEPITHLAAPPDIATNNWMKERQTKQLATKDKIKAFVDFQFSDERVQSGITYDPQIVDEQRWRLQVNHYDHGNGICVCDVDNDGRLDIYFTSQATRNELWRNLGGGKFEDISRKAGVEVPNRISVSAAFGDIDNDGDSDLFVTTIRGGNLLFKNDGKGNFKDITSQAGLDYNGHSSGAVFFDFDRDGKLDLFVTNVGKYTTENFEPIRRDRTSSLPDSKEDVKYYTGTPDAFAGHLKPELDETSILYRNEGGKFKDVTKEMGVVNRSGIS